MTIDWQSLRLRVASLHDAVIGEILSARREGGTAGWGDVARVEASDVLYAIDDRVETTILEWMAEHWPRDCPAELVMEGLEGRGPVTFPGGVAAADLAVKILVDPIDGTRMLMHDKRSAWVLTGLAPHRGAANTLEDIELAVMSEIPSGKQEIFDQVSAIRGGGAEGVRATRHRLAPGGWASAALELRPSSAVDLAHGFGSFARLLPQGMEEIAAIEMRFLERLFGVEALRNLPLFEDQYISTGGQLYELLSGRDRFLCDLRADVFRAHGYDLALSCHPYDLCTALVARELGCVVERPDGGPLDYPMDTVAPVSWVGYANPALAEALREPLRAAIEDGLA